MKGTVIIPFVCCWLVSSSAWAIDCLSGPGDPKTGWYAWREIEGRKCWFKKSGAMPPKSQLRWAKAEQEPAEPLYAAKVGIAPVADPPREAETTTASKTDPRVGSVPQIRIVRVRPVSMPGIAGDPPSPARLVPADSFNARFIGTRD